jgi:hypothetical protein
MFTTAHTLWLTLLTLTSLSTRVVFADRAITSPTAGATFQAGQSVEFRWYSDEEDEDRSRVNFDVALMSLTPVSLPLFSSSSRRILCTLQEPLANASAWRVVRQGPAGPRDNQSTHGSSPGVLL